MSQIDFDMWIGIVDEVCIETSGRSFYEMPVMLNAIAAWEINESARTFANEVMAECGMELVAG